MRQRRNSRIPALMGIIALGLGLAMIPVEAFVVPNRQLARPTTASSLNGRSVRPTNASSPQSTRPWRNHSALAAVPTSDIVLVLGHVIGGALGTPFVVGATNLKFGWYRRIPLPSWTPPDRAFAPIWTSLYALMGLAAAQIYRTFKQSTLGLSSANTAAVALVAWSIHCVGILSWAPVFFGLKRLRLGAAINVGLWISMPLAILPLYYKVCPSSAVLLLPYFAWLTFANTLNLAICRLNPTKNGTNEAVLQAQIAKLQKAAARYADGQA